MEEVIIDEKPTVQVETPKKVPTVAELHKKTKDNAALSKWSMALFLMTGIILAAAGNMLCVPACVIALMFRTKFKDSE